MDQNLVWRKSWCDEDVCAAAGVVVVVVGVEGGGIRNNSNWGIATYTGDSFQTDRTGRSTA